MTQIHKFPFSIAYADTDAGGIVYHARYIEIAERARMNWLKGEIVPSEDLGFVIRELNIKYIKPLKLGDDIIVKTEMIHRGAASLKIEHTFLIDDEVYAIINVIAAYIDKDFKPKRIPDGYLN